MILVAWVGKAALDVAGVPVPPAFTAQIAHAVHIAHARHADWPSGRIRLLSQASEGCLGVIGIEHCTPRPVCRVGEWGDLGQASALAGLQLTAHRFDVRDEREQTDEVFGIPRACRACHARTLSAIAPGSEGTGRAPAPTPMMSTSIVAPSRAPSSHRGSRSSSRAGLW